MYVGWGLNYIAINNLGSFVTVCCCVLLQISLTQEPVDLKENSTSSKCDESDSDSDYPTNKDGCETSCNTLQSKIDLQPNEVKEVSDTYLKEVPRESHVRDWEAGRLGSMAARLLKNVRIPLDDTTKDDSELVCTKV